MWCFWDKNKWIRRGAKIRPLWVWSVFESPGKIGLILFNEIKSMAEHAGIRHRTNDIVGGKECWDNYIHAADLACCIHPMCSSTRSHQPHNFNLKLITKAVQIVDSNKITHVIRCAWNASSMHAAFRIVPKLHSYTAPYYVRKVDCDKKFQKKE